MGNKIKGNKIKYGLKNVYYAPITYTSGVITFGDPVPIPGAVNISLTPVGENTPFYADDTEYYIAVANKGYDGTLEAALLPESFLTSILGETLSTTDKVLTESTSGTMGAFALLFEFAGDAKAIRHVLYNCKASRIPIESSTKGENIEVKTDVLTLTVRPLADGKVKAKTSAETPAAVYNAWYESVYTGETQIGASDGT